MRDFVSRRVAAVPPPATRRFFDIVATMDDVISLGIGEPDFVTPPPILQAGLRSIEQGDTHYTSNSGTIELRNAVADHPEVVFPGGTPVPLPTRVEDAFQVRAETVEALITPRTKALLIGYPNNPTGAVMTRANLQALAQVAGRHDLLLISAEISARLVYGAHQHVCFAALPGMRGRS